MANRYWVGGTANWDGTAGTKWATTSGGAGGSAVPTISDDVFLDGASGAVTITIATATANCLSIDCTGFTGTLAGSVSWNIRGNMVLSTTMTYSYLGTLTFAATTSRTITTNGRTVRGAVFTQAGGSGAWTFLDSWTAAAGNWLLTAGTLNLNGFNHQVAALSTTGAGTKVLNLGTGTLTLIGAAPLSITATGLTINPSTSTIKCTNTATMTFGGGGFTYYNVWFSRGAATTTITINGANTYNDFKDDGTAAHTIAFADGVTQTFTTFTVLGTAGNLISINSVTTATHTLSCASGTINCNYLNIQHSVATGGATWNAGANSVNNQAVATAGSGWIFPASATAFNQGYIF